MFERFDPTARKVVVLSQELARLRKADEIEVDHLLAALFYDPEARSSRAVEALGSDPIALREAIIEVSPGGTAEHDGHLPFSKAAKSLLSGTMTEALQRRDKHIGAEHMLLAAIGRGPTRGTVVLEQAGITRDGVLGQLAASDAGDASPGFQVKATRGLGRFRRKGG